MKGKIIDDNGEIIDVINEGDRIIRVQSVEYLVKIQDKEKMQEWKLENFYKGHIAELDKLMKDLSINEKAFLFSISPYISYDDCHLQFRNNVDIGTEDLVRITGLSRNVLYQTIAGLISKDIIYKGKNSNNRQYFVNPWLFCRGQRINKVLKTMFQNYRIRVMNGTKWKDIKDR